MFPSLCNAEANFWVLDRGWDVGGLRGHAGIRGAAAGTAESGASRRLDDRTKKSHHPLASTNGTVAEWTNASAYPIARRAQARLCEIGLAPCAVGPEKPEAPGT